VRGTLLTLVIGLAFTAAFASTASAGTIPAGPYQLFDHGFGGKGDDYGLRMDRLDAIFSVELFGAEVILVWNGVDAAEINGTLHKRGDAADKFWQVSYALSSVTAVGNDGFTATGGSGTLISPRGDIHQLIGKQNNDGLAFWLLADGHRIPGDDHTPVATGWLLGTGHNDWLVTAVIVPEPSTALLLGVGLFVIGACAMRLRIARGL
jgi:hypothetical protein